MSEYVINITKRVPNPGYVSDMKAWNERRNYGRFSSNYTGAEAEPQMYIGEQVLSITVSEATFAAIRKAALETL